MISKVITKPRNCPRTAVLLQQRSANILGVRGFPFASQASQASDFLEEGEYFELSEPAITQAPKPYRRLKKRSLADDIFEGSVSDSALKETAGSMQQNT